MSTNNDLKVGAGLAVGAILLGAVGDWKTAVELLPSPLRPYAESSLMATVLALVAIYYLWRAAGHAARLEKAAADALRIANESNASLQRRVENAEARLVQALDEQVISWAPAYANLEEHAKRELQQETEKGVRRLHEAWGSFNRRASRGYGPEDDTSKPAPAR